MNFEPTKEEFMKKFVWVFLMLLLWIPGHSVEAQQFRSETDEYFYRDYWPSGNLRTQEPLVDGQRHGLAEYFHDNGQLYGKIPWENGKKHGTFTLFDKSGEVEEELSYKHGELDGLNKWYYPGGGTMSHAIYYKDGKMHGNAKWFDPKGQITAEAEYTDGQLSKRIAPRRSSDHTSSVSEIISMIIYLVVVV